MSTQQLTTISAPVLRDHLRHLEQERTLAVLTGLSSNGLFMRDLLDELEAVRHAYIGTAVTEIASLRAQLEAPLLG
jgi:hypothetical protein